MIRKEKPYRVPYQGICAHCGKKVFHSYPWFTKNPDTHEDAKPLHEDCAKIYLFGASVVGIFFEKLRVRVADLKFWVCRMGRR